MSINILLVDDEELFTDVLSERLESRGFEVKIANSGLNALKMIKEKTYDAIVLDLNMPEMDGMETLKKIMEYNSKLQIIFLTGQGTIEKGVEAVKLGALDFLEKPADLDKLVEKVKEASTKRILLYEKNREEELKDILQNKSW
jgi:DNA-binding NtrC family response regulator